MKVVKGSDQVGNFYSKGINGKRFYFNESNADSKAIAKEKAEAYEQGETTASVTLDTFANKRNIFLFDDFDQWSSARVVGELLALSEESSDEINLFINSNGGVVNDLNAILDAIQASKAKVNTICLGISASCGAYLLAMGTGKRYIGVNSRTMIHKPLLGTYGDIDTVEERVSVTRDLADGIIAKLADRSGQDKDTLEHLMYKRDIFMNANESVAFGLADAVLLNTEELIKDIGVKSVAYNTDKGIDSFVYNSLKDKFSVRAKMTGTKPEGDNQEMHITEESAVKYLKETCSLDVLAIRSDNVKLSGQVATMKAELDAERMQHSAVKDELASLKAGVVKDKKDAILASMVSEGKISEAEKATYATPFTYMSLEECEKFASDKTPKVNMNRQSSGGTLPTHMESGTANDDTKQSIKDDELITAYANEHKVSYEQAMLAVL